MKACQLLSESCGWPLTVFLTPAGKPFYAATYIPKKNRFDRIGLLELIPRVKQLWTEEHNSLTQLANSINEAIASSLLFLPGDDMKPADLDAAFQAYSRAFDREFGGFGSGLKFPKPLNLLYLLRYRHRTGSAESLAMVKKTLNAMRHGGIYDQLGYGFHRYATDPRWRLPHFEKMLYNQALLILAYTEAYQVTADKDYAETAREIIYYVQSRLTAENGVFYSAEGADSEDEEGRYYLWSLKEIKATLNKKEAAAAANFFHLSDKGNFINPVTGRETGKNVLYIGQADIDEEEFEVIRKKLFQQRNIRPRPELDDKVLTDWNGLMIVALAKAAKVFEQPEYGQAAQKAATFILKNLRTQEGNLLHRWREGSAGLDGTAADYSFLIWGLLELYSWDFDSSWLADALNLTEVLFNNFWDEKLGGFFLTGINEKSLLPQIKENIDNAVPSSNSIAMLNLLTLSRLTGDPTFAEKASFIDRLLSGRAKGAEFGFPMFLSATDFALAPSQEVVIVGRRGSEDTELLLKTLRTGYFPNAVVLFKPAGEQPAAISRYAGFTEFMHAINNRATAYVCTNFTCSFPTNDPAVMLKNLTGIIEKTGQTDNQ